MNVCLRWGIFPGTADFTVKNQARVEAARPLYRRFIPVITQVSEAGWQPLTYARSPSSGVMVERFGDLRQGGRVYFTVMGDGSFVGDTTRLVLEAGPLGLGPGERVRVHELLTGEELSLQALPGPKSGQYAVDVKLPANEVTRVVRIATPSALARLATQQAGEHVDRVAATLRWSLQQATPPAKEPLEAALGVAETVAGRFREAAGGPGSQPKQETLTALGRDVRALADHLGDLALPLADRDICLRQCQQAQEALQAARAAR